MILKQEDNKIIRTIENRDKSEILNMFESENFGFIGLLEDQRPSIYDEIRVIDSVLTKEILSEEYLILEIEGIIVTYACVYQDGQDRIHIGCMITKEEFRNLGCGSYLLEFIMQYADQNNLTIRTETLTCPDLLIRHNFKRNQNRRTIDYIYLPNQENNIENKYPIFLDYEEQQIKQKQKSQKELKNYEKTLNFLKNIGFLENI